MPLTLSVQRVMLIFVCIVKSGMFLHHFSSFSTKYGIYQYHKSYNTLDYRADNSGAITM